MDREPLTLARKRMFLECAVRRIVVKTRSAGLSIRGRPKYRPEVVTYWEFDDPDREYEDGEDSLQQCDVSVSGCRR
jgi:hypothetical protein